MTMNSVSRSDISSTRCCPPTPAVSGQRRRRTLAAAGAILALCSSSAAAFSTLPLVPRAHKPLLVMSAAAGSNNNRQLVSSNSILMRSSSASQGTRLYADSKQSAMKLLDQDEFELHAGRAMDALRSDYPVILRKNPDFSIYDRHIEVIDPSGVKLHGLANYQSSFRLIHVIIGIFYCPDRSMVNFRMCFDKARQNIRIHWNAYIVPKAIFGGEKTTLHADGISVYELSRVTGAVKQHRIESLILNDTPLQPEQGIIAALRGYAVKKKVDSIPIFNTEGMDPNQSGNGLLEFRAFSPMPSSSSSSSVLFSDENGHRSTASASTSLSSSPSTLAGSGASADGGDSNIDWEALERKNVSRKKFGLPPLSPEEFLELQAKVAELDTQQQKRAAAAAEARMMNDEEAAKKAKRGGLFKKLFGNALADTCETNYDCERPQVCCDFGVVKRCCSSGSLVGNSPQSRQGQLAEVPVIAAPDNYPPEGRRF